MEVNPQGLCVRFDVKVGAIRANDQLPRGESVWELWEWDVVEIYARPKGTKTYYEFQISPLGQHFELEVRVPRVEMNRDYRSRGSFAAHVVSPTHWTAEFLIPMASFGASADTSLEGGLFAILGPPGAREYWSAFLPEQQVADFHKPECFRPLNSS